MRDGQRAWGCLGILVGILAVIGLLAWRGSRLFSPGPLSAQRVRGVPLGGVSSHAQLEDECRACHVPLQTQGRLCLRCHQDIWEELQQPEALHARLTEPLNCRACHPDHRGRDADLLQPARQQFDHEVTAFSLQKHAFRYDLTAMVCEDCHDRWPVDDRAALLERCYQCHFQADPAFMTQHVQAFHPRCLECHDGTGQLTAFDHTQTAFPLEGKHQQVACEACHRQGRFQGISTACQACHQEPPVHQGLFASTCEDCHTPQGWTPALWQGEPFDHARQTGFSLARHRQDPDTGEAITCVQCHPSGDFNAFQPRTCRQCHRRRNPDFMNRHLVRYGADCLQCHDGVDRMQGFDHARVFPLEGAHSALKCAACHPQYRFRGTPNACRACHEEPEFHRGLFGQQCQYCHGPQAWAPAALRLHPFPLDHGAAAPSECALCHLGNRYERYTCYGCHEHRPGDILRRHQAAGITPAQLPQCTTCHPTGQVQSP